MGPDWLVLSSLWIISIASIDVIHYLENQASQVQLERAARLPRVSDGLSLGIWAPIDPRTEQEKRADQLKDNIAFVAKTLFTYTGFPVGIFFGPILIVRLGRWVGRGFQDHPEEIPKTKINGDDDNN